MMNSGDGAIRRWSTFFRQNLLLVALISLAMVVPCFWHAHIEAGDLGSHVYNAWLAQLISKGQAPGLYLAHQWHNVLFDSLVLQVSKVAGFVLAEKVVVALAVLIFFWGLFALLMAMTEQAPWFLTPCIAVLAYGYCFNMGFLNYYFSIGLACWSLAIFLGPRQGPPPRPWPGPWQTGWQGSWLDGLQEKWRGTAAVLGLIYLLIYLAHPIGFLFAVGALVYLALRRALPGWWKAALPLATVIAALGVRWFLVTRPEYELDWTKGGPFYAFNGSDQVVVYGDQYATLSRIALLFGIVCVVVDVVLRRREWRSAFKTFVLPLELYLVAFVATALLPENLRTSAESAWIGLLASRLTILVAIFGIAVLGCLKPRKWHLAGFGLLAAAYFVFLFDDTAFLNRVERNTEAVLWKLPYGTRVVPTLAALPDSRIEFMGHLADRVCIGHCFTYFNYEAPSQQFRVRAEEGSPIALHSFAEYQDMAADAYVYREKDLPLVQLYQCDANDPERVCLRQLRAGDTKVTGAVTDLAPQP